MSTIDRKLVVIGLDGGSFNVIDPLIRENKLPNLKKMIVDGAKGELLSTIPPVTGPAWASFMTGKSPENHGLFDFVTPLQNEYERQIVNYKHIKAKTIWSILSKYGREMGVINVPVTYPPPKVNGFLVSGMLTPGTESQYTFPSSLSQEIENEFGEYILDVWWQQYGGKRVKDFIQDQIDCTVKRGRITLNMMQTRRWDFFMTVFSGTDRIQHALWKFLFPMNGKNLSEKEREIRTLIIEYYQHIDRIIGEIVKEIDGEANVIVMSDHGFGPMMGKFSVNGWLEKIGLLSYDKKKLRKFRIKSKIGPIVMQMIRKSDVINLRKRISPHVRKSPSRMKAYNFFDCIDWSKTKAYAASNTEQGLYLNLAGREPNGIVKTGKDSDTVKEFIISKLKDLEDPKGNGKLVSRVYKKEEIYSGPFASTAPDIVIFLKEGEFLADVQPLEKMFMEPSWKTGTGTHRMEGILIAYGKDIKKGNNIEGARIIDLAPTILHMMNVPIPNDMDGRFLAEIFVDEFINKNICRYIEPEEDDYSETEGEALFSDEEAEQVEEKLKDLGYL
jgi:predicted AlkP superfamily phosphohydrolase/phosphomutase